MERFLQDLRIGARSLRRTPGFAAVTIVTLALGIGLSTAVFTVADALLLRPLPVRDQAQLVVISGERRDGSFANFPLGLENARLFASSATTLDGVALFTYEGAAPLTIREGDQLAQLDRAFVSGNFFSVLGTQPLLGRGLNLEDDALGATPVVVLSHRAWQERFGGAADVLDRQLVMHDTGQPYRVVGVMPQGLDYPRGTDIWLPVLAVTPEANVPMLAFNLVGRLKTGATAEMARDDMTAFFERADAPVWQRDLRGAANPLLTLILGDTRPAVLVFGVASALLLLITCLNVANLLLVRGFGRVREVAVRTALGAGRGRVIAQLLTEHMLLAIAGGALGLCVAVAAVRGFVAVAPSGLPRLDEIVVDGGALAAAAAISAGAMLLFALAPALLTSRVEVQHALRSGARQSGSRRSRIAMEALVAGQIALALVVLCAAGLISRSLVKLEGAELSFEASRLLIGELVVRSDRYAGPAEQLAMLERLLPEVQGVPGVVAVSPVVAAPFSGSGGWDGRPSLPGDTPEVAASRPMLNMEVVAPSYFATFELPILEGRAFTDDDREGAPPVVILSASAARYYAPDGDVIGSGLTGPGQQRFTVVGVVPDTRYRDLRKARPSIYFPVRQSFFPFAPLKLAIRTRESPEPLIPLVRRVIAESAPDVALIRAEPFTRLLDAPLAQPRLNALLLVVFAGAAVVLAAVGLFGVMSTMVRQRTQEIGVRMALGASGAAVGRLVLGRGMALATIGIAAGVLGALAANRLLAAMLFDVSPTDAATLSAVALLLFGIAVVASLVPVRASARIHPAVALRAD